MLKLVPLNSVNNARSDDVWYCSGWYWKIWRNIDRSSRTPSNFTTIFLILWLIMSDRESETSDTTDPGSSLGNPSSFDSESDRNLLNSNLVTKEWMSALQMKSLLWELHQREGHSVLHRGRELPGAGLGSVERVARCSCATTWRSMGRTFLLRVQLSKVRLFVQFRVHVHFERKITQTRRKFGYQRTFCVCKIFSQNACKGEHLRVELTYTQCMITCQNNAVPEACDCTKKWVKIGLIWLSHGLLISNKWCANLMPNMYFTLDKP